MIRHITTSRNKNRRKKSTNINNFKYFDSVVILITKWLRFGCQRSFAHFFWHQLLRARLQKESPHRELLWMQRSGPEHDHQLKIPNFSNKKWMLLGDEESTGLKCGMMMSIPWMIGGRHMNQRPKKLKQQKLDSISETQKPGVRWK